MQEKIKTLRDGRYTCKRGVINLEDLDFARFPFVWGILVDEAPLVRGRSGEMMIKTSFIIATSIEKAFQEQMLDDDVLEEFRDDAAAILWHLQSSTLPSGEVVAMRVDAINATSIQFHDTEYRVQGIVVNFNFDV